MFDSVFIGMSGLQSFSRGLKVISNNVANMNTAGFKATNLSFSDMVYQQGGFPLARPQALEPGLAAAWPRWERTLTSPLGSPARPEIRLT